MFTSVGRRLALLNAAVVVLVIAVVGVGTVLLLRASLNREATHTMKEQVEAAAARWSSAFTIGAAPSGPGPVSVDASESHSSEENEIEDIFKRGDTLLYAIDRSGSVLINDRGIDVPGLPVAAGVKAALAGETDTRIVRLDGERVRIYTEPVEQGKSIVGAVQAARGEREFDQELGLVQQVALAGAGIGALIAVPAGLFLARRAMRPIDRAFRRQRTFIADASHELRTPLTLIRANVELAQRLPETPPKTAAELTNILEEIDRMARLVNDLLLLARVDENRMTFPQVEIDLQPIVQKTLTSTREKARTSGVLLTYQSGEPIFLRGDPDRLLEAIQAVLNNAITYTPAGGAVSLTVERHGKHAVIRVADTGIGIAAKDQARVFDRFYRADSARARSTGGTGLGLTIAKAIVEAHGGSIDLESAEGNGTVVTLTLPISSSPQLEPALRTPTVH